MDVYYFCYARFRGGFVVRDDDSVDNSAVDYVYYCCNMGELTKAEARAIKNETWEYAVQEKLIYSDEDIESTDALSFDTSYIGVGTRKEWQHPPFSTVYEQAEHFQYLRQKRRGLSDRANMILYLAMERAEQYRNLRKEQQLPMAPCDSDSSQSCHATTSKAIPTISTEQHRVPIDGIRRKDDGLTESLDGKKKCICSKDNTEPPVTANNSREASSHSPKKGGRPPSPRIPWILEQYYANKTYLEICRAWNDLSEKKRKEIDAQDSTLYDLSNQDGQGKSKDKVRKIIDKHKDKG